MLRTFRTVQGQRPFERAANSRETPSLRECKHEIADTVKPYCLSYYLPGWAWRRPG